MNKTSEEQLCAYLDEVLGATLQEMWAAFGSVLHQHIDEGAECLLLLVLSLLVGATNAAQIHRLLGLTGQPLYKQINAVTPHRWKVLLQQVCYQVASAQLAALGQQSPASLSRACVVVALDDPLIRRLGDTLGLVWRWWSGMDKRVRRGQHVIALVLVIGDRVIPLDVRIASKQGRVQLTKPVLAERMLRELVAQWTQRLRAAHARFGEVLLVVFADRRGQRRYVMTTALQRRAHEILRASHQRAQIDACWKRLTSILQIAQIRLPDPTAFRGALVCRILTYLLVDTLTRRLRRAPAFRKVTMRRTIELCQHFSSILDWINEHVHHVTIEKPNVVNYVKAM